jgi:hypothetical protein
MIRALAKSLPHVDNILWLIRVSAPFPTTAGSVLDRARLWNFSRSTRDFLGRFPADEVFQSRVDLLTRCEELELFLHEERDMPQEHLRSPQD